MQFQTNEETSTQWKLSSILDVMKLYAKSGFYKTLLFSIIFYPPTLLFPNKKIKIRNQKNTILQDEVIRYIKIKYGMKFEDLSGIFALGGLIEIFVKNLYDFFKINKNDVVYDIGATVGEYSLKCAKEGAIVYAFELEKEPYEAMKKHIKLNRFDNQVIPFHCKADDIKNSIDNFVKKTKKLPTLIKIDVEGDEKKVLKGTKNTLSKCKPRIILETHSNELEKSCVNFLQKKGYGVVHQIQMDPKTKLFFLIYKGNFLKNKI